MNIPYGIASFAQLREHDFHYVDKTQFIPRLESQTLGRIFLLFLRPRRFGKSLWLSVLEHYYDLLKKEQFEQLFDGLYIRQHPTSEKNTYLILRLEFTGIDPNQELEGIHGEVLQRLGLAIEAFCQRYQSLLPQLEDFVPRVANFTSPALLMSGLLSLLAQSPHPLYLLIDEYDNFTNSLISLGKHELYLSIIHESGFLREFYKAVKAGTSTGVIGRIFITGVSPVTMDDVTSGANIFSQVSLDPDLNAMAGFTHPETRAMLETHFKDVGMTLDPNVVMEELVGLYNGYRFSVDTDERVFNPDMVLYYLARVRPPNGRPHVLIDHNVRMDLSRLRSLLFEGRHLRLPMVQLVERIIEHQQILGLPRPTFPLEHMFRAENFVSLLFYLGLLSLPDGASNEPVLIIPNYVAKTLYWEALHNLLHDAANLEKTQQLEEEILSMGSTGELDPLMEYIFPQLVKMCSNRDLVQLSEKNVKFMFLPFLMMTNAYLPWSEVEANHGYADLLLIPSNAYHQPRFSFILEFKYVKLTKETSRIDKEGVKHTKVTALTRDARTKAVAQAFEEGEAQIARYLSDARLMALGGKKGWKAYTLVFEGLDSLHFRAPGGQKRKLLPPKEG